MSIFDPVQKCSKSEQRRAKAAGGKEPPELSRHNGHDRRVEDARAVRIEDELARRGVTLRGRGSERCGPCPVCGGTDRFSVNVKKQVWNCRRCERGGDIIEFVQHVDGSDFKGAVATLVGEPRQAAPSCPPKAAPSAPAPKKIVAARFDYRDENGGLLFQVERVEYQNSDGSYVLGEDGKRKKVFPQRRPDPARLGEWIYDLGDTRRVLYRLPELIEALAHGRTVVLVEGEAKADLLCSWNIPATCSPMGAKNWRADLYAATLCGADIVVLPDNDSDGRLYLDDAAVSLKEAGASVRVLALPGLGPKGDIINWAAGGGTVEQLHALIDSDARPWAPSKPTREPIEVNRKAFAKAGAQQGAQDAPPEIITRRASDITPEPISWLWKYWLARGKLHIIGGVPETGKTTIALAYAAIISSGAIWPDGTRAAVGNVLIWTSEDDPADTLIPRLIRMGAELSRIHFIEQAIPPGAKSRPFNPAIDMLALVAKAAAIGDVVLLILDPIVAAMPMTRNSHNNAETRNGMQPVVDFAEAADIATIGISHLTKGTAGKDPLERLNGSGAFGALPRLVMGAAKNEATGDGEPERIFVRIKSNIGPSGGGFGYHIDMATLLENPAIEATRIVWESELEGSAKELLNAAEAESGKVSKFDEAKRFLREALSKGDRPQKEIKAEALAQNIKWGTLERASKDGEVIKKKDGFGGWLWRLS